jgi:hypothetical protein
VILHNYSRLAGKTVLWDTSDSEKTFLQNSQDPMARARLESLGWLDRQIKYRFNLEGFRTTEFDHNFDVVCFGCSFTMGTGVPEEHSWPSQLQAMSGLAVANLGHAGSSNDTVFRYAEHYLPRLSPKFAVWLQTDMHRLELIDDAMSVNLNILAGDTKNPCANDYFMKIWFSSEINQRLNLKKNTLAFEHLCNSMNVTPVVLLRDSIGPLRPWPDGLARDLMHPGAEAYKQIATKVAKIINI